MFLYGCKLFRLVLSSEISALGSKKMRKKSPLSLLSFVLTCCLVTQYLCHPVGGACVCRKEDRNRCWDQIFDACDGDFHAYLKWVLGHFTDNIFSPFSSHSRMQPSCSKQPSLLNKHSCVQFAVWGAWLCASWGWGSLTWQIYSRKRLWKISTLHIGLHDVCF